jgi:hypothetical protein
VKGRKEGVCRLYSVGDRKMEIEGDSTVHYSAVQCSTVNYTTVEGILQVNGRHCT